MQIPPWLARICGLHRHKILHEQPRDRTQQAERVLFALRDQADALELEASIILRRKYPQDESISSNGE